MTKIFKMRRVVLILTLLWLVPAMALASSQVVPPYPTGFWISGTLDKGSTTLTDLSNFKVVFYQDTGSPITAYAAGTSDASGIFAINVHDDLRLLPLSAGKHYIGVVKKTIGLTYYGVNETSLEVLQADLDNGYKRNVALTLKENEGLDDPDASGNGPKIDLTVLLEGLVLNPHSTAVLVGARTGGSTADTALPANKAGECVIPLDATGRGLNNGVWITSPTSGQDYYLVIHQKLGTGEGNHVPVILKQKVTLTDGQTTAINLSDMESPNSKEAYTPAGLTPAMKTTASGKLAMRAGFLNNDKYIDVSDYGVWKGIAIVSETVDPNNPASVRSDINKDGLVDVTDYGLWKGTTQAYILQNGTVQTDFHVYVP